MKKPVILLIGPCPPPFGGVSIHIERLSKLLSTKFDIEIVDESRTLKPGQFNLRSFNVFSYLKMVYKADIIHIHSGLLSFRALHFFASFVFGKKIVITIHGFDPDSSPTKNKMNQWIIDHCDKVIFVSKEIAGHFNSDNFFIREAFLPPDILYEKTLPEQALRWIEGCHANGFLVCCANAWRLDSFNNEDLYGLDICIRAASRLRSRGVKVSFFFVVCEDTGVIDIARYRKQIDEEGLASVFLLYEAPLSFIQLIQATDIVLRPTNTDGDALTVREGLFMGKTVIASDVVERPVGTKLFVNRNVESFVDQIVSASNNHKDHAYSGDQKKICSGDEYLHFYVEKIYSKEHQN